MKVLMWLIAVPGALWVLNGVINEIGNYADDTNPHNKNRDM